MKTISGQSVNEFRPGAIRYPGRYHPKLFGRCESAIRVGVSIGHAGQDAPETGSTFCGVPGVTRAPGTPQWSVFSSTNASRVTFRQNARCGASPMRFRRFGAQLERLRRLAEQIGNHIVHGWNGRETVGGAEATTAGSAAYASPFLRTLARTGPVAGVIEPFIVVIIPGGRCIIRSTRAGAAAQRDVSAIAATDTSRSGVDHQLVAIDALKSGVPARRRFGHTVGQIRCFNELLPGSFPIGYVNAPLDLDVIASGYILRRLFPFAAMNAKPLRLSLDGAAPVPELRCVGRNRSIVSGEKKNSAELPTRATPIAGCTRKPVLLLIPLLFRFALRTTRATLSCKQPRFPALQCASLSGRTRPLFCAGRP